MAVPSHPPTRTLSRAHRRVVGGETSLKKMGALGSKRVIRSAGVQKVLRSGEVGQSTRSLTPILVRVGKSSGATRVMEAIAGRVSPRRPMTRGRNRDQGPSQAMAEPELEATDKIRICWYHVSISFL